MLISSSSVASAMTVPSMVAFMGAPPLLSLFPGRRVLSRPRLPVATSGDEPGPGSEPDTVVAEVRGEHVAQPLDRALRGAGIQPLQCLAGAGEAADPGEGGGHVRTVVD